MKVYVIRHGESETNLNKKWTGWLDVHLTDKGIKDAKKAGEFLKNVTFDKIFTSDLVRAIETAQNAIANCNYEPSPLLREINVGTLANKPLSVLSDEQRERARSHGYQDFDGETKEQFNARIAKAIKLFEAQDCQNIAVFTHAGWMRGMLDIIIGSYIPRKQLRCNNCAIAIFEYQDQNWQLHSWINLS